MAWGKAGSTTLASAGDDLDVTFTASKFNQILVSQYATGGNVSAAFTMNNDGGSLYAQRLSENSGAEFSNGSQTSVYNYMSSAGTRDRLLVQNFVSISGEEKLGISHLVTNGTIGAGTAPQRQELVYKYVPADLTDAITRVDEYNASAGSFDTDSNITVLGSDITPATVAPKVQDGAIFYETDTNKSYVLSSSVWTEL